jgi:hypothetical protein
MIIKAIRIGTSPGERDRFLELQRRWNAAMAASTGFEFCHVGVNSSDRSEVLVVAGFTSMTDLDRFMADTHDDLLHATRIDATYDAIDVGVYEVTDSVERPSS